MMSAVAQAQPNIALIKYWGKRDSRLNLPAAGSLSVTLDTLHTRTRVDFDAALRADELVHLKYDGYDGSRGLAASDQHQPQSAPAGQHELALVGQHELARVSACLDLVRAIAGVDHRARIHTYNSFPTGAGLASSASGFAALVVAASAALALDLEPRELSVLARQGSGSAARSIFGGFVEMIPGSSPDGEDCFATPLLGADEWPLSVVVAVTSYAAKAVSSGVGMQRSRDTSPFYRAWIEAGDADLAVARRALAERDFAALAAVSEHSCLKMHATMLSSAPGLMYWNGATVDCMHRIRQLREQDGVSVFFTVDAGPQVKAICLPNDAKTIADALRDVPGVQSVLSSGLGRGARVVNDTDGALSDAGKATSQASARNATDAP